MRISSHWLFRVMLAGFVCAGLPLASQASPAGGSVGDFQPPTFMVESRVFLDGHPDVLWRVAGLRAYEKQRFADAFAHFQRAASFADKPSQAIVAEMLWDGRGVLRDRSMAYVWMDMAAERGNNRTLLVRREGMWSQLSEQERQRAVAGGAIVFDQYADVAAKPRQERVMSRALRSITGSRSGSVGYLSVSESSLGKSNIDIKGELIYDRRFWLPDTYWAWQDQLMAQSQE